MDSINTANTPTTQPSAIPTASSIATESVIPQETGDEFNSFLQLLTAQIRNQDPLAPLDSTQFVEQLATFSNLEQQVQSNTKLDTISSVINDLYTITADQWLGETVSIESSWVPYSGEAVEFEFDAPPEVDRAILTIADNNGNLTWSETLNLNEPAHSWNGNLISGDIAPPDSLHNIRIDLYSGGQFSGSLAPRVITTVTDVSSENGKMKLGTAMNMSADLGDVRKVE